MIATPFPYDWRAPDTAKVFAWRLERLRRLRERIAAEAEANKGVPDKEKKIVVLPALFAFYRDNPIQFIMDWGITFDPRNVGDGGVSFMPFILYDKQIEWMEYALRKWRAREPAATPKSREVGLSWCACALAATLSIFNEGMEIGFGSRLEEYVDKSGEPKALFYKIRAFVENLPAEFRAGWSRKTDAHMRITFPYTSSVIFGEGGDNIGRGARAGIYFVDESAFLMHPDTVDASLSMTTDNRHDISSYNGTANSFYRRCTDGKVEVFPFHWRDDPRKDDAWYAKKCDELAANVVAAEIDMNAAASVDMIVIPSAWVQSAVDAHRKLGIVPSGQRRGAMDVADEGVDLNAYCGSLGVLVDRCEAWSGKGDDIFASVEKCFALADMDGADGFDYDADGLGAGVRGDARVVNLKRKEAGQGMLVVSPFRGSGEVVDPDKPIPTATPRDPLDKSPKRTNKDFFANAKAQGWWNLRVRFQRTHRAVADGADFDPDEIISLSSDMPALSKLTLELSQPTYSTNGAGKIVIDKAPDGARSPNYGDSVMIRFAPKPRRAAGMFDLPSPGDPLPAVTATATQPVGRQAPRRAGMFSGPIVPFRPKS